MASGRDKPRDIEDAPDYSRPPTPDIANMEAMQDEVDDLNDPSALTIQKAKTLAVECYEASTNWLNSGRRLKWNDSLKAFQGIHPSGSKYLSSDYRYRSRLFRPMTRTMMRKDEASTAQAFFSNEDVVNISAQNDNDKMQQASAEINQRLLQYRLTNTIPWFQTVIGARQDAGVMGVAIAKAYWKYGERYSHTETRPKLNDQGLPDIDAQGKPLNEEFDIFEKMDDHPWVDLIPPENFRFHPGADWRNPIASSPYLIELIPMYFCDIKAKIEAGEWLPVSDGAIRSSLDEDDDTTRRSREQGRVPGKDGDASWEPADFEICWVHENIIRWGGRDWHYWSIGGAGELLSAPEHIENVYLQGIRPYVYGIVTLEAHKTYPNSKVELVRDLQTQTNDVANLRLDNVKLALNPRQVLRTGSGIDPADARTFMPGKILLTKNPREDIVWDRPTDVTAPAYQEQDRISMDFDALAGNISNSTIQGNRQVYEAVGNMEMMQGQANIVEEYEQRVFAETFVEPLMKHLIKLEQAYETDPVILTICGQEAQLYQKYGINEITDQLLKQEVTVKVNVGTGATNPERRLQRFLTGASALGRLYGPAASIGTNFEEVTKEIFGLCGYKDGARFFKPGFDATEAMMQMAGGKGKQQGAGAANDPNKVAAAQVTAQGKVEEANIRAQSDERSDKMDLIKELIRQHGENERNMMGFHQESQMAAHKAAVDAMKPQQQPQMQQPGGGGASGEKPMKNGHDKAAAVPSAVIHYDKSGKRIKAPGAGRAA